MRNWNDESMNQHNINTFMLGAQWCCCACASIFSSFLFRGTNLITINRLFVIVLCYRATGLLKSPSVQLSEEHVRSWTKQLLEGVKFLHENHILHRDIKSANILITKGNVLKIADWGLARFYQKSNHKMTFRVVTLWYRSPELLCGVRHYGPEVDIWSVGCIFGELKTRQPILAVKDSGARCSETQSESNQLDLLWHECGTPQGEVLKKYESYPLWETCKPTKPSNRKIRNKFDHDTKRWDTRSLLLLERFLGKSKLYKKCPFLYFSIQLASCVMWSGALDSFIIPLSYSIISLVSPLTTILISDIYPLLNIQTYISRL